MELGADAPFFMPNVRAMARNTLRPLAGKGADMPNDNTAQVVIDNTQAAPAEPERTFTQAEVDAIVSDRLKRDRAKYADYEDVKAKAAQVDGLQGEKASLQEQVDSLRDQLGKSQAENLRMSVAAKRGVRADLLQGSTEDELEKSADALIEFARGMAPASAPVIPSDGNAPSTTSRASELGEFAHNFFGGN